MDCYLHIGTGKTGTSTIQKYLAVNRAPLLKHGYYSPTVPGKARHTQLYLYCLRDDRMTKQPSWRRLKQDSPEIFREEFAGSFVSEIKRCKSSKIMLTDEALSGLRPEEVGKLKSLLTPLFENIYVVVYLRRQDEHVVSRYQQTLKTGNILTIEQFMKKKLTGAYDYHRKLKLWAEHFGAEALRPRLFDTQEFVGGSLLDDFRNALDIPDTARLTLVANQNESIDADQAEFLRLFNKHALKVEHADADRIRQRLVDQLARTSLGDKITMREDVLDAFMDRWQASNAAVAREFFDRRDGVLFRSQRRTKITDEGDKQHVPKRDSLIDVFYRLWTSDLK